MTSSTTLMTSAVLVALVLAANPARGGDDCDDVVTDLKEAIEIAAKNYEHSMQEIKNAPSQAAARKHFCAATGEFLGISTAFRAVIRECAAARSAIDSLTKSIDDIQGNIDKTCK
jgi:hypothetical protein